MERPVTAIILAAGKSSRMGTPKQLIRIGDRSLLQITLDAVSHSKAKETVLVLGYLAEAIAKSISLPAGSRVVINQDFEHGMSASIHAGLNALSPESSAALIVLADQPWIHPEIIDALIAEYERSGSPIVIPVFRGFRGNPVLIDRSLFPEMLEISGDIGCRSLFGLHADQIRKLPVNDIGILVDIDNPEDVRRIQEQKRPDAQMLQELEVRDRTVDTKHLVIVGSDEITFALTRLAKILNFDVTVIDPLLTREDLAEADQIVHELDLSRARPGNDTSIVVASRGKYDEEALQQAIGTDAKYVALVGNKKRGGEIIARLRKAQASEQALQRIRFPAGLAIGASTPQEIALSILAEIVQQRK